MMTAPIRPGHCKFCGRAVRKILEQYPIGHKLAGFPSRIGPPLPGTVEVSFLLMDGSHCRLRLHQTCAFQLAAEGLPLLWANCLMAMANENRVIPPKTKREERGRADTFARMATNVPIEAIVHGDQA